MKRLIGFDQVKVGEFVETQVFRSSRFYGGVEKSKPRFIPALRNISSKGHFSGMGTGRSVSGHHKKVCPVAVAVAGNDSLRTFILF